MHAALMQLTIDPALAPAAAAAFTNELRPQVRRAFRLRSRVLDGAG